MLTSSPADVDRQVGIGKPLELASEEAAEWRGRDEEEITLTNSKFCLCLFPPQDSLTHVRHSALLEFAFV